MTIVSFAAQLGLSLVGTAWIIRRDMRRLSPAQLERCWNDASFWSAVVAFGPLCLPVHFAKSRRSMMGALLGVFWMLAVWAALIVVSWLAPPT